jgi:hypothetical protein
LKFIKPNLSAPNLKLIGLWKSESFYSWLQQLDPTNQKENRKQFTINTQMLANMTKLPKENCKMLFLTSNNGSL